MPDEYIPAVREAGISEIFGPGTTTGEITDYIKKGI